MAPFQFQPIIESVGKAEWQLTAPHELRDKVWDALNLFHKYRVIRMEGGTATQISVSPNPGYQPREALAMLVVATYSVTSSLKLDEFWRSSVREHLDRIREQLNLKFADGPTEGEILPALQVLILELARRDLRRLMEKLKGGYNLDYLQGMIDESAEALRRLVFNPTLIPDVTVVRRGGDPRHLCQKSIEYMEMCLREVEEINSRIDAIRNDLSDQVDEFGRLASTDHQAYELWGSLRRNLIVAADQIERIRSGYDYKEFVKAYRAVKAETPPAPVGSKNK